MNLETVTGYKATDKDMKCRGFQFVLGEWHKHDGEIAMCESGFHFCEHPSGPWYFYRDNDTRIFRVEARGVIRGEGPGADLKHVAKEIRLLEEICFTGDRNTGHRNTGNSNAGHRNTGNSNAGDSNAGHRNTGDWNTGNWNTGHRNTGDRNTGHRNTGNSNAGHRNTGCGNCTDNCAGHLCCKIQPTIIFDKIVKEGTEIDINLINELSRLMISDEPIEDVSRFLKIPNATESKIKKLHLAHIERRNRN